jgi:hypothetical protein
MMKVVVDAKKNQGGLNTVYGNKVKLDPTVLALMEKRVADGIAAARAELMAQYGMAPNGALMSDAERQELEELRGRVQELAIASAVCLYPAVSLPHSSLLFAWQVVLVSFAYPACQGQFSSTMANLPG